MQSRHMVKLTGVSAIHCELLDCEFTTQYRFFVRTDRVIRCCVVYRICVDTDSVSSRASDSEVEEGGTTVIGGREGLINACDDLA